jgi:hypothetical protein
MSAAEAAAQRLGDDFIAVVRHMAEEGAAAALYDQYSAMERQVYARLERIERHLGIFADPDAVPDGTPARERAVT